MERDTNQLSGEVIGAAIEVHKILGPGLLESVYEECLCRELSLCGISYERQVKLPVMYKGTQLDCKYIQDIVVEDLIIVELKAVDVVSALHRAQLLSYLRLADRWLGLLINFNVSVLSKGVERIVNGPKR